MEKRLLSIFFSNIWSIEDRKFYDNDNTAEYSEYDLLGKYIFWRKEVNKNKFTFITDIGLSKKQLLEAKEIKMFDEECKFNVYRLKNNKDDEYIHSFEGTIYDALLYIKNQETKEWGGMSSDY